MHATTVPQYLSKLQHSSVIMAHNKLSEVACMLLEQNAAQLRDNGHTMIFHRVYYTRWLLLPAVELQIF